MDSVFQMNPSKSGIVGYYMRPGENPKSNCHENEEYIDIQYLESKDLNTLFCHRRKSLNCMVQKFLEPKDDRDHVFKVMWTPQFCLINKIESIYTLSNPRKKNIFSLKFH